MFLFHSIWLILWRFQLILSIGHTEWYSCLFQVKKESVDASFWTSQISRCMNEFIQVRNHSNANSAIRPSHLAATGESTTEGTPRPSCTSARSQGALSASTDTSSWCSTRARRTGSTWSRRRSVVVAGRSTTMSTSGTLTSTTCPSRFSRSSSQYSRSPRVGSEIRTQARWRISRNQLSSRTTRLSSRTFPSSKRLKDSLSSSKMDKRAMQFLWKKILVKFDCRSNPAQARSNLTSQKI